MQIRLKNQISQRSVIMIRRSVIFQIISDVLSEVRRTDTCLEVSSDPEDLDQVCLIRVGAKLCRAVALSLVNRA